MQAESLPTTVARDATHARHLAHASRLVGAAQRYQRALEQGDELDVVQTLMVLHELTADAVTGNAILQPPANQDELPMFLRRQA